MHRLDQLLHHLAPSPVSGSSASPAISAPVPVANPHRLSPSDFRVRHDSNAYGVRYDDVLAAHNRIKSLVHETPVLTSTTLSTLSAAADNAGMQLFFKCEIFQKIGAFKARGGLNSALIIQQARKSSNKETNDLTLVTHSSGNHAQAVALAARAINAKSLIIMPRTAPAVKKAAVRGLGGEIIECGPTQADREKACADALAQLKGNGEFLSPYDDPRVISGQGTIALEFLNQVKDLDALIVPVGGGGMLSGICIAAKSINPWIQIIAAEPLIARDCFDSLISGKREKALPPASIADGLLSSLGDYTFPIIRDSVREVVLVPESEIIAAMKLVWERMKLVIEPSAAVGVAVALSQRFKQIQREGYEITAANGAKQKKQLRRVGIVLCGGNVDLDKKLPWQK